MSEKENKNLSALASVRNVGIIAHIDAGKTTLTEHFLFYTGKNYKVGEVDSGNTVMDYLEEERKRGITIVSAAATFEWNLKNSRHMMHLIDTPGHIDFTAEVERSLRVIDGAIVIFSAVEGVQAQSEKVWVQSDSYNVSKMAFINKLDRSGASFTRVLEEIRMKFPSAAVVPLQIPDGHESELKSVIDLVTMKSLYFEGENGEKVSQREIPANFAEKATAARKDMLDRLANISEAILELCLEEKEVGEDILREEIRKLVIGRKLVPVFCGAAKKNIGVQPILDAIAYYFPSPLDMRTITGHNPKTQEEITVSIEDKAFCGLVFKVVAGDSADLIYMRTYSGLIHPNEAVLNSRTGEKVRIKRLLRLYASNVESEEEVGPGDIIGVIGPSNTFTGDTLCAVNRPVALESIHFPEPIMSLAIEPKSSKDKDRLETCLGLLVREDPTFYFKKNESTGQVILSGMGELHLEIKTNRILKDYNLQARIGLPQVAFRETFRSPAETTGTFNRMMGEQFYSANARISFEPVPKLPGGIEVISEVKTKGTNIPEDWISSAKETLLNGLKTGGNWGYPLIYIRAKILDVSSADSKTAAGAISAAVLDAIQKAFSSGTIILEPIVRIDIVCPENFIGEISGYLQSKRAVINHIGSISNMKQLICEVPLSEMFGFSKSLPKISSGRAAFSMEPCGYQEISSADLERISQRNIDLSTSKYSH